MRKEIKKLLMPVVVFILNFIRKNDREFIRIKEENDILWQIYKICSGCKKCTPGIVYSCRKQHCLCLKTTPVTNCPYKEI